jgi:hypothetical protein
MNTLWRSLPAQRVAVLRWTARGLSLLLFLGWGAFFVEHLEWFTDPRGWPPAHVARLQTLHGIMLLGLLIGWKWELAGAVVLMASSIPFFLAAAGGAAAQFILVTNLPAMLWMYLWASGRRRDRAAASNS